MEDTDVKLLAEQLGRFQDQIRARMDLLDVNLAHQAAINDVKFESSAKELGGMQVAVNDHETRIRAATDGVTTFKAWVGLASGGSVVLSIIGFLKAMFGG